MNTAPDVLYKNDPIEDFEERANTVEMTQRMLQDAAGPVADAFRHDMSPTSWLMGPVGSAKTTTCVAKCFLIARQQHRSIVDGKRKLRIAVVRSDYRRLWESTIPSYLDVWPREWGQWHGGKGNPASHIFELPDPQTGEILRLEFLFRAIGNDRAEDFARGFQANVVWMNEADLFAPDAYGWFFMRVGRAFKNEMPNGPDGKQLPPIKMVFGDFNAPNEENWLAKRMIDPRYEHEFHVQPGALLDNGEPSPAREGFMDDEYYIGQRQKLDDYDLKRMVMNKLGYSRTGMPVYGDYHPDRHDLGEEVRARADLPVTVGVDGGGKAAAVIGQRDDFDRVIAYDEVVTAKDQRTDGYSFGKRVAEFMCSPAGGYARHVDRNMVYHVIDPSNQFGGTEIGANFMDSYASGWREVTGLPCRIVPAETNDPDERVGANRRLMQDMREGRPRKMVSKRCPNLRAAYRGGYKLHLKNMASGDAVWRPVKGNHHDNVADADQYMTLFHTGIGSNAARPSGLNGVGTRIGTKPVAPRRIRATAL
ncbi:hypothetical protein [Parvularcula sp. LCG005]|uniref:hypothetical protein n=1 Tax=Parvularcula sp. LCG005 TaxID=3078805 RepID=UPI0029423247|nr:hypothetical protein [Parvularcula sp. LCG005]WOI54312.1 hypothetical protein RUI03_04750 [Parvularcula sp. LCG005]